MKKFFLFLISAIFLLTTLTACDACNQEKDVAYYLNWVSTSEPVFGYKETCVYDVNYRADYNEHGYNYSAQSGIGVDIIYDNSTYTVITEVLQTAPAGISVDSDYTGKIYKITTDLKINVNYSIVNGYFNDRVTSTVYFYDHNNGFAPIYSEKSYDTTTLTLNNDGVANKILRYIYNTKIVYDKGTAKISVWQPDNLPESTSVINVATVNKVTDKKVSGDYKKFIDNETLLFASRNLPTDKTTTLKVASTSFMNIEKVNVTNLAKGSITINANGETVSVPCATMSILRDGDTYTGSPIIVDISTDKATVNDATVLDSNAYICKMVTKLPSYTGAVEYLLKSVEHN